MKTSPLLRSVIRSTPLACAALLGGCGSLGDSLKLHNEVLVKVPIREPVLKARGDGWEFRHMLEAPRTGGRAGQWYVAWNNSRPVRTGLFTPYWRTLFARTPEIAEAAHAAFGTYPLLIEPNKTFTPSPMRALVEPKPAAPVNTEFGSGSQLVIGKATTAAWPDARTKDGTRTVIDPLWHLDDAHSQLRTARGRLQNPGDGIVIGHLDNGLDGQHSAAPMRLARDDWHANAVGLLDFEKKMSVIEDRRRRGEKVPDCELPEHPPAPERTGGTHGMGTVGLLAGSWVAMDAKDVRGVHIRERYDWLGGAPFAKVVPVRVAPWVFSANTGELAYGIDYASRVKGCDVITMSHGGSPTQAWADAVNAAYERGTAIFAAESDFFSLMPEPFMPRGFIVPSSPVYPAAFRRVVGVTGVTSDQRSYASNSLARLLRAPGKLLDWAFRGSYGADDTSTSLFHPDRTPDNSESRRQGQLHAYPVAAYSPNVPWLAIRKDKKTAYADGVDLDGAGTSASTPQAAAAAALWLQKHRGEFSESEWHGWQKSEAAYQALLRTAHRDKPGADAYLGAGALRADDALKLSYAEIKNTKPPRHTPKTPPPGSLWFGKSPNDYFDGTRSFQGILGIQSFRKVEEKDRAVLDQTPKPGESREEAFQRLYFNMMLLDEWHHGRTPNETTDKDRILKGAKDKARATAAKH